MTALLSCPPTLPSNEIFWSNRAAALLAQKQYDRAADDARRVIALKPEWIKGHARLGAALLGADDAEAREVLERAIKLEPSDASLRVMLDKALRLEAKQAAAGQHTFKKKRRLGRDGGDGDGGGEAKRKNVPVAQALAQKRTQLLSFEGTPSDDDEGS